VIDMIEAAECDYIAIYLLFCKTAQLIKQPWEH